MCMHVYMCIVRGRDLIHVAAENIKTLYCDHYFVGRASTIFAELAGY